MAPTKQSIAATRIPWVRLGTATAALFAAGIVVLSACSDLVAPRRASPARVAQDGATCPDCLTPDEIDQIQRAIDQLANNPNGRCAEAAFYLQWHLDAGDIKWTTSWTDYGVTDGSTIWVSAWAFDPGELANTLSHEASHADFGYHDPGHPEYNPTEYATQFGNSCAGVI